MPGKGRFSKKQDRQAQHIADSEQARGMSTDEAKRVGYATVNKGRAKRKSKRR